MTRRPRSLPAAEAPSLGCASAAGSVDCELAALRLYRDQVAWNIAATPHLDHDNARNTLVCTDRAIERLEAQL